MHFYSCRELHDFHCECYGPILFFGKRAHRGHFLSQCSGFDERRVPIQRGSVRSVTGVEGVVLASEERGELHIFGSVRQLFLG